jgi:iron complex outermembrane receptor protein
MNYRKSILALAIASILTSGTTLAEESLSEEKKQTKDYEVIVVTQKRIQTLKEVPVSVSAYGGEFIDDFNINNAADLSKYTPGLNGGNSNDSFVDSIGIRGIVTQDYGIGGDPSIGLYFDGVYQGRSGGALSTFFDISRVEVTKGPQGTLFGRNAASGAISIYSNEAVDGTEGSFEAGYGSDNLMEFTGVFNTAISDDAFIRVAAFSQSEASFIENQEGGTLRDKSIYAVRSNFVYEGWNDSKLKVSVNYEDRDMDGGIYRSIWTEGDERSIATDLGEQGRDVAEVFSTVLDFEHDFGAVVFTSQTAMKNYKWDYVEDYDGTGLALGNYAQNDDTEYLSQEFRLNSANDDSDIYWFVGVNLYQEKINSTFYNEYDEDAFCAQLPNLEEWDQAYDSHTSQPENYYSDCHELIADDWYGLDLVDDATEIASLVDEGEIPGRGDGEIGLRENIFALGTNSGYGIYGDITWTMTPTTDLTLGGRFSYDNKEFSLNLPDPDGWLGHYWLVGGHTDGEWLESEQDWSEFTPRVAVNHKLNEDINIYANYSRGYKAGGFNTFAFNLNYQDWTGWDEDEEYFDYEPDGITDETDEAFWGDELYGGVIPEGSSLATYEPEIVDSYEIGLKGEFFDNSLKINVGAYYYDYTDFQGLFPNGGGSIIKNIGKAKGQGIEFDATYQPTESLRLYLASAIQNSEVKEGEDLNGDSLQGKKLAAPEISISFIGSYYIYLESDVDLTFQASYTWQSDQFGDEFMGGTDLLEQGAYGLAGLQFNANSKSWQLSAYINNLFDEAYYEGIAVDTGINHFGIGRGRTAGIKLKYSF